MNDFSFRFDRKFLANYLYSLYLKKKKNDVWIVTILTIFVQLLNVWKLDVC